jgi:hypothetical protein
VRHVDFFALLNNRPIFFLPTKPIVSLVVAVLLGLLLDERARAVKFAVDGLDGDLCAVVLGSC